MQLVNHTGFRRFTLASAAIPATGRGFGIPFDRQHSVFAGSVAGTVEPPHRRPIVFGKSAKRRANTPAVPEGSRGVRPGLKPKTGPYKQTQKQGSVLTFGVLSEICRSRKQAATFSSAMPANRERPRRSFVLSGGRKACGRTSTGALPYAPDLPWRRRCRIAARSGQLKKCRRAQSGYCSSKKIGLTITRGRQGVAWTGGRHEPQRSSLSA
jgi:hypothetical protein